MGTSPPAARERDGVALNSDQKLRIVLEGIGDDSLISGLCETNRISEAEFYDWRDTSLAGATNALSANGYRVASSAVNGHTPTVAAK